MYHTTTKYSTLSRFDRLPSLVGEEPIAGNSFPFIPAYPFLTLFLYHSLFISLPLSLSPFQSISTLSYLHPNIDEVNVQARDRNLLLPSSLYLLISPLPSLSLSLTSSHLSCHHLFSIEEMRLGFIGSYAWAHTCDVTPCCTVTFISNPISSNLISSPLHLHLHLSPSL